MTVFYSKHAREQMVARGITEREVEDAVKAGSKHIQPPNKILADYRYFSVVYKQIKGDCFVITVKPRW